MQLTKHFSAEELNVHNVPIKDFEVLGAARCLCQEILEPIREHFGKPVIVTSGRRTAERNKQVGGEPLSWHLYQQGKAAADFYVLGVPPEEVYDWMRLESNLPFDKAILEFKRIAGGVEPIPSVIHVQMSLNLAPRRLAYRGMTSGVFFGRKYAQDEVRSA